MRKGGWKGGRKGGREGGREGGRGQKIREEEVERERGEGRK